MRAPIDSHIDRRNFHGPQPIAAVVPSITRGAFSKFPPSLAQLLEAWPSIIGSALAAVTNPRQLTQGTLTIGCSGPMAMELQHLAPEVMQRINQYLGSEVVRRLRFLQTTAPAPLPPRRQLPIRTARNIDAIEAMPDGPLRDALRSLAGSLLR